MTTARDAFEAKYQRSADDPASAEMLAVFTEGWEASRDGARALMPEPEIYQNYWDEGITYSSEPEGHTSYGFYTAAQMLEIAQAADKAATERERERAARVCEEQAEFHQDMHNSQAEQAADACAQAIRETK